MKVTWGIFQIRDMPFFVPKKNTQKFLEKFKRGKRNV